MIVVDPLQILHRIRQHALTLPGAYLEFQWGGSAVKVIGKLFVFFGPDDGSRKPAYNVKLPDPDPDAHAHALSLPGAALMGVRMGRYGWVYVPFDERDTPPDLLCEWVEDSYRSIAPQRLIAELDARAT